ncbi:MAG: hypothetical protein IKM61_06220 [Eubacteriaceae bacterium]|nr:hypothetical protein [Eubacteriaceae bacterium]
MSDFKFNSQNDHKREFQLASGYISETEILFENENITVKVHARGHVEFFDSCGKLLADVDLASQEGGREVYMDIVCDKEDDHIILQFPEYKWIDNYPNCDSENDRWDTIIIGNITVKFDVSTNEVSVL